jgi:MFS family permease
LPSAGGWRGITIGAIETGNAAVLLLGTAVAGLGYGPAFTGAYRTVVARAPADDRAGLIAAAFILIYLSTGIPALIAGITTTHYGLHATALVFSAAVTGLAAAAAGTFLFGRASHAVEPQPMALPQPPPGQCTVPHTCHPPSPQPSRKIIGKVTLEEHCCSRGRTTSSAGPPIP